MKRHFTWALVAAAAIAAPSLAAVIITQQAAPAPTYGTTLNFDEPGGPVGTVPPTYWLPTLGLTIDSGAGGGGFVGPHGTNLGLPWLGTGNSMYCPWGTFMTFSNDLTEFSAQDWDTSGPPGPFGGGLIVVALNNGTEVAFGIYTPSFNATRPTWYNITTTDGSVFDEVRFVGNGFFPENYIDNLSWNAIPEPTTFALLALGGLVASARRR